jgi:hypothetical protein
MCTLIHKCYVCTLIPIEPAECVGSPSLQTPKPKRVKKARQQAQLITQMAKRSYCGSSSVAGDFLKRSSSVDNPNYGDGFVKPMCVMLRRSNRNDVNASGRESQCGLDLTSLVTDVIDCVR